MTRLTSTLLFLFAAAVSAQTPNWIVPLKSGDDPAAIATSSHIYH